MSLKGDAEKDTPEQIRDKMIAAHIPLIEEAAKKGQHGIAHTAQARLTSCWATEVALAAAQFAMFAAGSSGLRNDEANLIQRAFRDLQTGSTHRHIDQEVLIECTQVALGIAEPGLML